MEIAGLKIETYSRIHITLIGMNVDGYRRNGGIGFSIDKPTMICKFVPSDTFRIIDNRSDALNDQEQERLLNHLRDLYSSYGCVRAFQCKIESDIIPHSGFGSSTMLYLSVTEALFRLNDIQYSREQLVKASGRGGTSGIGINTYFDGGFICDIGVKNTGGKTSITPSSISENDNQPFVIYRHLMPQWEFGVCISKHLKFLTEKEEVSFFSQVRSINQFEINEILYHAIYGIVASIEENDFATFKKAIKHIQSTQWKSLERSIYGKKIESIEQILYDNGADAVGMSSLGPLLFFTSNNVDQVVKNINNKHQDLVCFKTQSNNSPRLLSIL